MKGRVYAMALGFAIFTGATFNLARHSVQYFSASDAAAWRFGIAAVFMIGLLVLRREVKWEGIRKNGLAYLLLGIIGILGFNSFFFLGMKYTSPLNGALIMGTNPLVTAALAFVLLKAPVTGRQAAGMALAFSGVVLVLTKGSWEVIQTLSFSPGDILILLGNVCWALYGVLGRKMLPDNPPIETTAYTMASGAFCLIILSLFSPNPVPLFEIAISAWGAIAFMAVFTSVLGILWWNKAMKILGPGNASLFFNFVPIVTLIISLLTGETIAAPQILGTFLVILGVLSSSPVFKGTKKPMISKPVKAG